MKTRHPSATAAARPGTDKPKVAPIEESLAPDDVDVDVDVDVDDVHVRDWGSEPVLIACVRDATPEGSAPQHGRFLIISPTVEAFEELSRQSPCITDMWILVTGPAGSGVSQSRMDHIDEVATWTAQTLSGRPLLVLRGRNGYLLGIDDDGIFGLGPSVVHWSGKGCYRGAPAPADASTV